MASSNQRRRQVARAKYERQQLRRSTRGRRRRRWWRRAALVVAIVGLVGLIVIGVYLIFFADATTTPTAAHVTYTGRAQMPSPDPGSIW